MELFEVRNISRAEIRVIRGSSRYYQVFVWIFIFLLLSNLLNCSWWIWLTLEGEWFHESCLVLRVLLISNARLLGYKLMRVAWCHFENMRILWVYLKIKLSDFVFFESKISFLLLASSSQNSFNSLRTLNLKS